MKPIDLIIDDLGEEAWSTCFHYSGKAESIKPTIAMSPFSTSKTYLIPGQTRQFDFPSLPRGSYCVYDANEHRAIRLTRAGKEIQTVLAENRAELPTCDPVRLAQLILTFFDGGIKSSHHVLQNINVLRSIRGGHGLNEEELSKVAPFIETTRLRVDEDQLTIRAVTLCGSMHAKRNLGIEQIRVSHAGIVKLIKRETLSKKIFKSVPAIKY